MCARRWLGHTLHQHTHRSFPFPCRCCCKPAAVKPWVSAPSSFLWSGLADRFSIHKGILLSTFIVSTLTRTSTVAAHSFTAFMLLAAAGEFTAAPVGVMADAAVVAACKQDTDYGKSRLWCATAVGEGGTGCNGCVGV